MSPRPHQIVLPGDISIGSVVVRWTVTKFRLIDNELKWVRIFYVDFRWIDLATKTRLYTGTNNRASRPFSTHFHFFFFF